MDPRRASTSWRGEKLLALFGHADARDFADVYVLPDRFDTQALIEEAQAPGCGVRPRRAGPVIGTIRRFTENGIPLAEQQRALARTFFAQWVDELRERGE